MHFLCYIAEEIFVISWYCSWSFISLFLPHSSSNRLHRRLWRAHTPPFTAQSHRKADWNNNLYLLVLVPCCILHKGRCSPEQFQRHHRRESPCRLVVIYHKHTGKLTVNNCSDAQVQVRIVLAHTLAENTKLKTYPVRVLSFPSPCLAALQGKGEQAHAGFASAVPRDSTEGRGACKPLPGTQPAFTPSSCRIPGALAGLAQAASALKPGTKAA